MEILQEIMEKRALKCNRKSTSSTTIFYYPNFNYRFRTMMPFLKFHLEDISIVLQLSNSQNKIKSSLINKIIFTKYQIHSYCTSRHVAPRLVGTGHPRSYDLL